MDDTNTGVDTDAVNPQVPVDGEAPVVAPEADVPTA